MPVLSMHLAPERIAAGRGDLGRRDSIGERVGWAEERVVHPERLEHPFMEEGGERLARDRLDHEGEDVRAEVGVDVALTGLALEIRREHPGAGFIRRGGDTPELPPGR